MGMVSFNIMHTNDLDKHTINWYTNNIGGKTMKRNPNDDYIENGSDSSAIVL